MHKDVIDVADVLDRVQDDRELLVELLDIFEEDYQIKIRQMRDALAQGDADKVRDLAHSIKGAAGNISARKVFHCAQQMERLGDAGDLRDVPALADELDKHFRELQVCMREIRKEFS